MSSVARLKVAPANVMTIIVRPFISSPPCAPLRSPARALARLTRLTPPLGAGAFDRPADIAYKATAAVVFSPESNSVGIPNTSISGTVSLEPR